MVGECDERRDNRLQRKLTTPETGAQPRALIPPIVHDVLGSSGQPLDPPTRAFMEPRFGHDFSQVRVHTDARPAESARAVNALAYTVGRDVVFGARQFVPESAGGRKLIAHELAHTLQQPAMNLSNEDFEIAPANSSLEREAQSASEEVMTGSVAEVSQVGAGLAPGRATVQRQALLPTHPVLGLGTAKTLEIEQLINNGDRQGAVDQTAFYAGEGLGKNYRVDSDLLANGQMTYDPSVTASDASTAMPSWDYINNKAEPAKVRIGPSAFSSVPYLYSVILHEYQHVLWNQSLANQQIANAVHGQGGMYTSEVEASAWELLNATESGLDKLPDKIAVIWSNLNAEFWKIDPAAQASMRPLVLRAQQKAQTFVKGSGVTLVPFAP